MALREFTIHLKSGQALKIRAENFRTSRNTVDDEIIGFTVTGEVDGRIHTLCPSQIVAVTERDLRWWQ